LGGSIRVMEHYKSCCPVVWGPRSWLPLMAEAKREHCPPLPRLLCFSYHFP
jgi:hypothetical protein